MTRYLRHESGRTAKIIKEYKGYKVFYFYPNELQSKLHDSYKTLRETKRNAEYFLTSGLVF